MAMPTEAIKNGNSFFLTDRSSQNGSGSLIMLVGFGEREAIGWS